MGGGCGVGNLEYFLRCLQVLGCFSETLFCSEKNTVEIINTEKEMEILN